MIQTESHAARVVLEGDDLASAAAHARQMEHERKLCFIHPYDDPDVIAGQGTLALEVIEDCPDIEVIVVPIGGGGLISGVATALKALKLEIKILGVQAAQFPFMREALLGHETSPSAGRTTIAEGIAVKQVGGRCLPIVRALVDEIVLVTEPEIERAVSLMILIERPLPRAPVPRCWRRCSPSPNGFAADEPAWSCQVATSTSACWRTFIASNDVSVDASVVPNRKPVSSCGKNPLGTAI